MSSSSSSAPSGSVLGRALCIVTGASRGFGRAVARDLSRLLLPGSVLVIVARSGDELRTLQAELRTEPGSAGLEVKCVVADLSDVQGPEIVVGASRTAFTEDMDRIILVNNAASLGDVSRPSRSFTSVAEVDAYLSLNVSSCLSLSAQLLQAFPPRPAGGARTTLVNVTSLYALQPCRSWVLYCTGKAAREMMFRVLAEEEPHVRVLSYSPGPLDTDMQLQARTRTGDADLRRTFSDMFAEGQLLSCEASSAKLMKLLLDDSFTSGAHVDFYDL